MTENQLPAPVALDEDAFISACEAAERAYQSEEEEGLAFDGAIKAGIRAYLAAITHPAASGAVEPALGVTEAMADLIKRRKSIDPKGTPNLSRKWMDEAVIALTAALAAAEMEAQIRQIVDDALNSAIPEPWEVSEHAAKRIMALIALSHPAALSGGDSEPAAPHRTAGETIGGGELAGRIWFDTEFIEDGKTIELLSIGMVRADGATYYAEPSESDHSRASDWVKQNVLPHLTGETKPRAVIAREIIEFAGKNPEFWAYYADYDWVALCQLYGTMMDLPTGWPMFCRDLRQAAGNVALPKQNSTEHNALDDAIWTRDAFNFLSAPPPGEPVQGVTEAMVDAAKQAVWNTETPFFMRDHLMYDQIMRAALTAALATAPEGSGGAVSRPPEFLGRCAHCLDNAHLDGSCASMQNPDCIINRARAALAGSSHP